MRLLAAAAVLLCACAPGPRASVDVAPGRAVSAETFRRIAVAPFADRSGQGRLLAAKVVAALSHLDYSCVDPGQLDAVIGGIRRDPNEELTPEQLAQIKKLTLADAVLTGEVSSTRRSAGIALVDAGSGDLILRARLRPAGEVFGSLDELADAVGQVFAQKRERRRAPASSSADDLPEPD